MRSTWIAFIVTGLAVGCKSEIRSPSPEALSLTPSLVCAEQLETVIAVSGERLSPLPIGALTDTPGLRLPALALDHELALDGAAGDGHEVALNDDAEADQVRWIGQSAMEFDVYPSMQPDAAGSGEPLDEGMYGFSATNADGQTADLPGAITVVHRPTLAMVAPNIVCTAQHDNTLTLTGGRYLQIGEALPTVHFGALDRPADSLDDCIDLPGPTAARYCATLIVTLPAGSLTPGIYDVGVTNPAPAACFTTEPVQIEVVPPPTLEAVAPDLSCVEQYDNEFVLTGTGMIELNGTLPAVAVGDWTGLASSVEGCTDLLGPAGGRSCTQLAFTLPMGAVPNGLQPVVITNPAPADCHSEEPVDLEIVPPPRLDSIEPELACSEQHDNVLHLFGEFLLDFEGTLPTVHVGGVDLPADALSGCVELPGTSDARTCTEAVFTLPADALEPGLHEVTLTNPDPGGCVSTEPLILELVPPPTVASITPQLVCIDQGDRAFDIGGEGFVVFEGTLPDVTFGAVTVAADDAQGCSDLPGPSDAQTCTGLTVTLPQGSEAPGVLDVVVTNPAPADCSSTQEVQIEVVGPPTITEVVPDLACSDQIDNLFTVTGTGFVDMAGTLPAVRVGAWTAAADSVDGCTDLLGPGGGRTCTTLVFTVPVDAVPDGVVDLVITNPSPADCATEEAVSIEFVPAPVLTEIVPLLLCVDQFDSAIALTGSGFVVFEGGLPFVQIGDAMVTADSAEGCIDLPGPSDAQSCSSLLATLPAGAVPAGIHDVAVLNPDPAGCVSTETVTVEVVPPARLDAVDVTLVCSEQFDSVFTLTGDGFLNSAGGLPTVAIGDWSGVADSATGCTPLSGPGGGETCTGLVIGVPAGSLTPGAQPVFVTNPAPADCASTESVIIDVVSPPTVTSLEPAGICQSAVDTTIRILGEGFLEIGGALPAVVIGGLSFPVDALAGCTPLSGGTTGQVCTELDVTVPTGTFTILGDNAVEITNPAPAACVSSAAPPLSVVGPPEITSVEPTLVCTEGGEFDVYGTGFQAGLTLDVSGAGVAAVDVIDSTHIHVVTGDTLSPGLYDVGVTNPDGCGDLYSAAIQVVVGPLLFYVDPPVVYSGVTMQVSLYVSGVTGTVTEVILENASTGESFPLDFQYDPTRANVVLALVPAGLPDGSYRVSLADETPCVPFLDNALAVRSDLTVAVDSVVPPFGWADGYTAVDVRATDPAPAGFVQFGSIPRIYLNPDVPGPDTVATNLRSVSFQSATLLKAVVPPGLAPGEYDVIVVNPDNTIGLLDRGFTVTIEAPPFISSISPARTDGAVDTLVNIQGSGFRNPTVDITCRQPDGTIVTRSATATPIDAERIDALLPSGGLPEGTVCVVRVTSDDGSYFDYSAVSVGSPSGNLFGFTAGPSMVVARRGLVAAAGRATAVARYVYAIGGDDGTDAGAMDTIEVAPVDSFGTLGNFRLLPGALPAPRTRAAVAQIGRFLFVVGGHDGTGPVDTVLRAQVLDPLAAPQFADLGITFGDGTGLDAGVWSYRISAVFDASDAVNPGGESLASDPIVVRVPDVPDKIHLTVAWTEVDGAAGYRVYRTATADGGSGTEELLAEVAGGAVTSFSDLGGATTSGILPLPDGSLGEWATVATLPEPRVYPCVTTGGDPALSDVVYLYIAGGLDDTGTVHDEILYLDNTIVDDRTQVAGTLTASAETLSVPRYECGGFSVDDRLHTVVGPGETWIYFGSGRTTGAGLDGATDTGQVTAGGELTLFQTVDDVRPPRAGYGYAAASNFLYVFGAAGGTPGSDGREGQIDTAPVLANWNAMGGRGIVTPRYLMGSAQESAVIFVLGGETDAEPASATVEYANY